MRPLRRRGISARAFMAQSFHSPNLRERAAAIREDCAGCSEPITGTPFDSGCDYFCTLAGRCDSHSLFCSQACWERDSEQRDTQASRAFHGA